MQSDPPTAAGPTPGFRLQNCIESIPGLRPGKRDLPGRPPFRRRQPLRSLQPPAWERRARRWHDHALVAGLWLLVLIGALALGLEFSREQRSAAQPLPRSLSGAPLPFAAGAAAAALPDPLDDLAPIPPALPAAQDQTAHAASAARQSDGAGACSAALQALQLCRPAGLAPGKSP
jgi:hypothetical protein